MAFIANRIKTVFQDYGLYKDEIEASLSQGFDDIYDIFCRVKALHEFRQQRPNNLVRSTKYTNELKGSSMDTGMRGFLRNT